MKKIKQHLRAIISFTFVALLFLNPFLVNGQNDIPARPEPPRLVNDMAGLLSAEEQTALERKLVTYYDSTSTQIAIVVVKSLNGYDINDMAVRIGQKWGVGQKGKNNGIVILIKPKINNENGKVCIVNGYGVEALVTDALSKRIIENEITPAFREGQYYQGLNKATNVLFSLLKGEFSADQYMAKNKKKKKGTSPLIPIIIVIIIIIIVSNRRSQGPRSFSHGGADIPFWMLMGGMMNSGRSGNDFGDFNSGGGDFGGFGGGDFGGGGASGEW
ncbi:MAG: TPM domain-containing protein [Bacteroidota bacterium]|nr:TPM domain-containing protein [Bacteroidota bacterium]